MADTTTIIHLLTDRMMWRLRVTSLRLLDAQRTIDDTERLLNGQHRIVRRGKLYLIPTYREANVAQTAQDTDVADGRSRRRNEPSSGPSSPN